MADNPATSSEGDEGSVTQARVAEMVSAAKQDMEGQLASERVRSQRLETALTTAAQGANRPAAPSEPAKHTRESLQKLVDSKDLTPEQAGAKWQEQEIDDRVTAKVAEAEQRIGTQLRQGVANSNLQTQVDEYKAAMPEVMNEGTTERESLKKEYQWLLSQGHQAGLHTELLALRSAFGEAKGRSTETTHQRGATRESSSSSGKGNRGSTAKADGGDIDLTDRQRVYYTKRVDGGVITWPQVRERFKRVMDRRRDNPNQVIPYGS